jgi:hypothetical protein
MQSHRHEPFPSSSVSEREDESETFDSDGGRVEVKWSIEDLARQARERSCLLVIEGSVVDASSYIAEHVRVFWMSHPVSNTALYSRAVPFS